MVKNHFKTTKKEFDLLTRKGVYPYGFATGINDLKNARTLPEIEHFYNDLDGENCSKEDYEHAKLMWTTFKCENMLDYTNLYCMLDVLLLAEIVMDFRDTMWTNFNLDMTKYLSLPHMSLDIMLKMTGVEIDLISDQEMSDVFQKNIRGGHSFVNTRYSRANDDPNDLNTLLYLDA